MQKKLKTYDVSLRPIHYASVSGGKDSLMMLIIILKNLAKYPLDMVIYFDLEIDWGWSKNVIAYIEKKCNEAGIKFIRIKPRKCWEELYKKYGFPNNRAKWCNSDYKLDAKKQLNEWVKSQNCRPVAYIGLCADEVQRFQYEIGNIQEGQSEIYPLAEEQICESDIAAWASTQSIFEVEIPKSILAAEYGVAGQKINYYRYFDRQGCMLCPSMAMKEMAFLALTSPHDFNFMFDCIKETEERIFREKGKEWKFRNEGSDIIKERVLKKWVPELVYQFNQMTIFDYIA